MLDSLTNSERLARIGEILAIGVRRFQVLNQGRLLVVNTTKPISRNQHHATKDETTLILEFLRKVPRATPKEIRDRFGFSRTTAYRRLKKLEDEGLINRSGSSRDVVYEIAATA